VGSCPRRSAHWGHQVAVFLPRYGTIPLKDARRVYDSLPVWLGAARYDTSIWRADRGVPYYFLDCPELYDREGLYGVNGGGLSG